MTPDQKKALELYVRNFSQNILRITGSSITFDEAIYLLQKELIEVGHNPYDYCKSAGFSFE